MSKSLLPCPFCGSPAAMSVLLDDDNEPNGDIISAWVACPCGVEQHESRTEAEATMRWNARAATYTEICMNEKCPRGAGTSVEVVRADVGNSLPSPSALSGDQK